MGDEKEMNGEEKEMNGEKKEGKNGNFFKMNGTIYIPVCVIGIRERTVAEIIGKNFL